MLRLSIGVRFLCTRIVEKNALRPSASSSERPADETIVGQMKFLNVAEKNDAAKTIAGLLSNGSSQRREGLSKFNKIYEFEHDVLHHSKAKMVMTSVSGHLLNLEFPAEYRNWQRVDPLRLFDAPTRKFCPEMFVPIKKTLERECRGAHGLIIWTDCDREGENIGFEIIDVCKAIKPNLPVYRAKFSEITANAVRRALQQLLPPDELQSRAVDVRTELDLRIGAAFTRFQTMRYQRLFPHVIDKHLVSYGSCQIPTLGFVAKRFKEVEAFQPQPFWKLRLVHTIEQLSVEWLWARNRLFDQQCCAAIYEHCRAEQPLQVTVTHVTNKSKSKWRPVAMDTIELEKLGSRKLKLSAKQTMTIAEKLYTQGFISYPRTETNSFSKEIDLKGLVEQQQSHPAWGAFAAKVLQWGCNPRNGTKSDQAHPPIHPTKATTGLGGDEQRVYELIVRHFLACVSRDALGAETIVQGVLADEEFSATGLCILERNYLEVYVYEKWNAKEVHAYEVGQTFEPTELSMRDGKTSAPDLLTEAELIAMMDKHGIGTDATHAEHINTIMEREYIGKIGNGFLVPGKLGMGLVEGYESIDLPLAQPQLRAGLEKDLKLVCEGRREAADVLAEQIVIYRNAFRVITEKATRMDGSMAERLEARASDAPEPQRPVEQVAVMKCPRCGTGRMAIRPQNEAYCLSCLSFPDCRHTIWFPGSVVREATPAADDVPRCVRCGSRMVRFRLRSVRNTVGLEQRRMQGDDGLTYETCVMCDSGFQGQCLINPEAFAAAPASRGGSAGRSSTAAPTSRTNSVSSIPAVTMPPPAPRPRPRPTATVNPVPVSRQTDPPGWVNPNRKSFGNSGSNTSASSDGPEVKCPKCERAARRLTVRKEGANQGREFYACQTECNFFQWADAVPSTNNSHNNHSNNRPANASRGNVGASGSRGPSSSTSNQDSNNGGQRAKRKCSNCRQEGHTVKKCPRLQPNVF